MNNNLGFAWLYDSKILQGLLVTFLLKLEKKNLKISQEFSKETSIVPDYLTMVLLSFVIKIPNSTKEQAFNFVSNFNTLTLWDPGCVSSKQATAGKIGIGTKFDLITVFKGNQSPIVFTCTEYKPHEKVVYTGLSKTVTTVDTINFKDGDQPGTCVIEYIADINLRGFLWLFTPFVSSSLKGLERDAENGLKTAFEKGLHEKDY